jgi:hypothetical protein
MIARNWRGNDETAAVFCPEDDRYLVDRERHANHYEVAVEQAART